MATVAPEKQIHPLPATAFYGVVIGDDMATMTYKDQLLHPNWQRLRLQMLDAAGWACQCCKTKEVTLHVHHKRYVKGRMAWEYTEDELDVLCKDCHADEHEADSLLLDVVKGGELPGYPSTLKVSAVAAGLIAGYLSATAPDSDLADGLLERAMDEAEPWVHLGMVAASLNWAGVEENRQLAELLKAIHERRQIPMCELLKSDVEHWISYAKRQAEKNA